MLFQYVKQQELKPTANAFLEKIQKFVHSPAPFWLEVGAYLYGIEINLFF